MFTIKATYSHMLNTDILIFRHFSQRAILTLDCSLHDLLLIQYTPGNLHDESVGGPLDNGQSPHETLGTLRKKMPPSHPLSMINCSGPVECADVLKQEGAEVIKVQ